MLVISGIHELLCDEMSIVKLPLKSLFINNCRPGRRGAVLGAGPEIDGGILRPLLIFYAKGVPK